MTSLPPPFPPPGSTPSEPVTPRVAEAEATPALPAPALPAPALQVPGFPAPADPSMSAAVDPSMATPTGPGFAVPALPSQATADPAPYPVGGFATPPPPISYVDDLASAGEAQQEQPAPVRNLLPAKPFRILAIVTWLSGVPLAFVLAGASSSPVASLAFALLSQVALAAWSGIAVENVGRARPATVHHNPPRALPAAGSWLLAPVLIVLGIVLLSRLDTWVDDAPFDDEGTRSMVFVAAVLVFAFCLLIAAYQPYRVLGRASRWVGGASSKFRKWFVAPFVASLIAAVVVVLAGLIMAQSARDETSDAGIVVGSTLFLVASAAPWITFMICGSRAMIDLEEATSHQHRRLTGSGSDYVMPLNPTFTAEAMARPQI